jgi:hypothetical protein
MQIDMLEFLPEYLGGLFDMLSDPNKDIRQQVCPKLGLCLLLIGSHAHACAFLHAGQAYAALSELLREITQSSTAVELGNHDCSGRCCAAC